MAGKEKGFAQKIEEIHEEVVGEGRGHALLVHPINKTSQTDEFEVDFVKEMGKPAQFLNIEATEACTFFIKWVGTNWVEYPKGLQADVPLVINSKWPVVRAVKGTPSATCNVTGQAMSPAVPIREGR